MVTMDQTPGSNSMRRKAGYTSNLLSDLLKSEYLMDEDKDCFDQFTSNDIKLESFEVLKVIGRGAFAKIY